MICHNQHVIDKLLRLSAFERYRKEANMRYKVINTEETVTKVTNCTIVEIDDEEV